MSKLKSFHLLIIAIVIIILLPFIGQTKIKNNMVTSKGPDVIPINLPDESYGNEMPSVNFLHSLHNQAVEGKCTECHIQQEDALIFKFKRTDNAVSKELYHDNCIGCHVEKKAQNKKTGPLTAECRSCHGVNKKTDSPWTKIDFDKSLHFIHETSKDIKSAVASESDNCSACHHKYNTETKKTFYKKGEEESCTYCHKDIKKEDTRSLKDASHDSCVACHTKLNGKEIAAGPITCTGCHDVKEQSKIKAAKNITRLKRNQPDETLITGRTSEGDNPKHLMNPVAFNHKLHEAKTSDCKTCHHNSLKKCNECHTSKGSKDGSFIRLEKIMHDTNSDRSCVGCHNEAKKQSDCAACHDIMPQQQLSDTSCMTCHNTDNKNIIQDADLQKALAKQIVTKQSNNYSMVPVEKIPEKVIIDELSDEYKPSEFPHLKVINAINKRIDNNDMAKVFHKDQQTLCMGCHHNSPKSLEPPKCASCHGKEADITKGKPHLKGAYHGQCITCHQKMDVKQALPTDCIKCHAKK
jgi:class III cytochrome C family protein